MLKKYLFKLQIFTIIFLAMNNTLANAAEGGAAGQGANMFGQIAFFGVIFVVFYFLMIRPQNKRAKEQRDLLTNLKIGDEVVTSSGIYGKINKVNDGFFVLNIADGVEIKIQKQAVAMALPKGSYKAK